MPKAWLTTEEYAARKGVSDAYVRKLAGLGQIPGAVKRGGQWLIPIVERTASEQPMQTIAVFNQAGGVGKTTLALNLGYHLAQRDIRVLLVDLDPQATLTAFMGVNPADQERTVYDALLRRSALPILRNLHGMDLVPANILLAGAEQELVSVLNREGRLRKALDEVRAAYDVALIDCPPSLGLLAIVGLSAADAALVPVQTHFKAYLGTDQLLRTVDGVKQELNPAISILGFVPMQYARGTQHDRDVLEALATQLSVRAPVLTAVPMAADFKKATVEAKPLGVFNPRHPAVLVFEELAEHVMKALFPRAEGVKP
jgi:chromosome partitioning protein